MSNGHRKRKIEITNAVKSLGFAVLSIYVSKGAHYVVRVKDDVGHVFRAWTGCSCSSNTRRARLNFRQDVRRQSNRLKGLIDE